MWETRALEQVQAGLSWITILRKREGFRAVFHEFDPARVARRGEAEVAAACAEPRIVRHRGTIAATIGNARTFLRIEGRGGFAPFLWRFTGGRPVVSRWSRMAEVPAETRLARAIARALAAEGFRFAGPTTV